MTNRQNLMCAMRDRHHALVDARVTLGRSLTREQRKTSAEYANLTRLEQNLRSIILDIARSDTIA